MYYLKAWQVSHDWLVWWLSESFFNISKPSKQRRFGDCLKAWLAGLGPSQGVHPHQGHRLRGGEAELPREELKHLCLVFIIISIITVIIIIIFIIIISRIPRRITPQPASGWRCLPAARRPSQWMGRWGNPAHQFKVREEVGTLSLWDKLFHIIFLRESVAGCIKTRRGRPRW